jgi:hypothetical protein
MEERDQLEVIRDELYKKLMELETGSEEYKATLAEYLRVSKHMEETEQAKREQSAADDKLLLEERRYHQEQEAFKEQKKSTRVGWGLTIFTAILGPLCYNEWLSKAIEFDKESIAHFPSVRNLMSKMPIPKIFK